MTGKVVYKYEAEQENEY
nr:hypothetical protein [Staphylococcus aureus]